MAKILDAGCCCFNWTLDITSVIEFHHSLRRPREKKARGSTSSDFVWTPYVLVHETKGCCSCPSALPHAKLMHLQPHQGKFSASGAKKKRVWKKKPIKRTPKATLGGDKMESKVTKKPFCPRRQVDPHYELSKLYSSLFLMVAEGTVFRDRKLRTNSAFVTIEDYATLSKKSLLI